MDRRNVLIIGKTGTGKSSLGNLITKTETFKAQLSFGGVTEKSAKQTCEVDVNNDLFTIHVVDTPGLSDANTTDSNILDEISEGARLVVEGSTSFTGIHTLLFVIAADGRFSQDDSSIVDYFAETESTFWNYAILVVTKSGCYGTTKDERHRRFKEALAQESCPQNLKTLLKNMDERYVLVESKSANTEPDRVELLQMIQQVSSRHSVGFTSEIFQKAKEACERKGSTPASAKEEIKTAVTQTVAVETSKKRRCFPGDSSVITKDGVKPIHEIKLGEKLLSVTPQGSAIFSEVVTFLHYEPKTFATYLAIQTECGSVLHVSGNHLVFTTPDVTTLKFKAVFASFLQPGDYIPGIESSNTQIQPTRVTNITSVRKQGVYAPMTRCGTIVVDGSVASCYASYPSHAVAHAVMAPLRIYYIITKQHRGLPIKEGVNPYASFLYKLVY